MCLSDVCALWLANGKTLSCYEICAFAINYKSVTFNSTSPCPRNICVLKIIFFCSFRFCNSNNLNIICLCANQILELKKGSSQEEIRSRYRELTKKWHPDKFLGEVEKEEAHVRYNGTLLELNQQKCFIRSEKCSIRKFPFNRLVVIFLAEHELPKCSWL